MTPLKRRFGCRMYSIPLVLLFHTMVRTTSRWSIRLTTRARAGIRRRPACGPRPEHPPAAERRLLLPVAAEEPRHRPLAVEQRRGAHAPRHGAPRRFTRVAIRRARTEPTTRLTGGRRATILQPTVALLEADSLGRRPAAAQAAQVAAVALEAVAVQVVAAARAVVAAQLHLLQDRSRSDPTKTSRSA